MVTALVCFGLFQLTGEMLADEHSDYVNPVLEEIVKGLPLLYLASRKKIVFFIDSVICGAAVGGGFSILENIFYLLLGDGITGIGTVLFRGLEVALIHMGCSAIVASKGAILPCLYFCYWKHLCCTCVTMRSISIR